MTETTPEPTDLGLRCPECEYNLTGAPGDRCPECGWEIDVEALAASTNGSSLLRRWTLAVAALAIGLGLLVLLVSLLSRHRHLSIWDCLIVLSLSSAGLGHVALGRLALSSRRRWPMAGGETANVLRFAGWFSVGMGILGAMTALDAVPTPRIVRGVQVNGVLEFALSAFLFILPGSTLLALRLAAFAKRIERPSRGTPTPPPPFVLEACGRYRPDQLRQSWSDAPRSTSPAIEAAIARTWELETALARQNDGILFNGDLARLIQALATPQALHLTLGPTCYRDFLGTNLHQAASVLATAPHCLADALGISATVITGDGFLVLGRRGPRVAFHAGYLHSFGGLLESADRREDGGFDIFGAARRELSEELAIPAEEITEMVIVGLVRDREIHQPELVFDVTVTLARAALAGRFASAHLEPEHVAVECVHDDPEAILPFLQRTPRVTPVAQAALLLHGLQSWGAAWFEQACYLQYGDLP